MKGEVCSSGKNIRFWGESSLDKHMLIVYHMPEIVLGSEISGKGRPLWLPCNVMLIDISTEEGGGVMREGESSAKGSLEEAALERRLMADQGLES